MKISSLALLIPTLFLASTTVSADSYQSFSHINYSKTDLTNWDSESWTLGTQYFFDARETLGPLNEFDYINAISNVSANYSNRSIDSLSSFNGTQYGSKLDSNTVNINGEWFTGNFLVGGGYSYRDIDYQSSNFTDDDNYKTYHGTLGYLITEDLLIKVNMMKGEETNAYYTFNVDYNFQLNQTDYIGFGYNSDDEFDFHQLSTKYFMALSQQSYLVLGGSYTFNNYDSSWDIEDLWHINSSYYLNQYSSISASYDKNDNYSVSANHFFNKNYSLSVSYGANTSEDDFDTYGVNFTAQF